MQVTSDDIQTLLCNLSELKESEVKTWMVQRRYHRVGYLSQADSQRAATDCLQQSTQLINEGVFERKY